MNESKRSSVFGILSIVAGIIAFGTPRFLLSMILLALFTLVIIGFIRDGNKVFSGVGALLGIFLLYAIYQDEQSRALVEEMDLEHKTKLYTVKYSVICPDCDVNYTNDTGGTDDYKNVSVEWERSFEIKGDEFVHLSAQNQGINSKVTAYIYINGRLIKEESSSGEYAIASVSCRPMDIYDTVTP